MTASDCWMSQKAACSSETSVAMCVRYPCKLIATRHAARAPANSFAPPPCLSCSLLPCTSLVARPFKSEVDVAADDLPSEAGVYRQLAEAHGALAKLLAVKDQMIAHLLQEREAMQVSGVWKTRDMKRGRQGVWQRRSEAWSKFLAARPQRRASKPWSLGHCASRQQHYSHLP